MKDDGVGGTFAMVWRVPIYNFRNGEFCARKSIGIKVERQYYRAYEQSRLVVIPEERLLLVDLCPLYVFAAWGRLGVSMH